MERVKKTYAWNQAIELAKELIKLCDEFSDTNKNVLVGQLQDAIVAIPAGVAADLQAGREANLEPVIKLATVLELVHAVYPAVDTGRAPELLSGLTERLESKSDFTEERPADEPQQEVAEQDTVLPIHNVEPAASGDEIESEEDEPVEPTSVEPRPAPVFRSLTIKTEDDQPTQT